MGLTADVELRMTDASLVDFFNRNSAAFSEIAQASFGYARGYVLEAGLPVRRDDVAQTLELALRTNALLRAYLASKKLSQKYWYRHFADLILDRLWDDLVTSTTAGANNAD